MAKKSEKTDWKALLKTSLPLSQQTYEKLDEGIWYGHVKWKDMSLELKNAYNAYDAPERKKQWEKREEEGMYRAWE